MRDLWKLQVGWDEQLGEDMVKQFNGLLPDFNNLASITFPRSVCWKEDNDSILHIFCDASNEAYGCVAYVVSGLGSNILMSRSRVAPMKAKTTPQLELTAVLLGCRLAKYICNTLPNKFQVIVWSDNLPCLQWVDSNKSSIVYVRNRVSEISSL